MDPCTVGCFGCSCHSILQSDNPELFDYIIQPLLGNPGVVFIEPSQMVEFAYLIMISNK